MRWAMGRKITMAANPWKVVALGSLHAHPPRGHRVPAHAGRCDRTVARGAAHAAPGGGTRGGSVHVLIPRRARSGVRGDSGSPVPVLPASLGEPDARGNGAEPDEAVALVPPHARLFRARRNGRHLAAESPRAV